MKSLRTCCACTCKDYVCRHSQPKWQCHFGSSLFSAREEKIETRPPSPEDGRSWGSRSITSTSGRCSCSPARGHWQVECSASESPDREVRTLPHPTQVGDGELYHHWRSGWPLGYCPGSKATWTWPCASKMGRMDLRRRNQPVRQRSSFKWFGPL